MSGIHGNAFIGPSCPVEKDPPEPGCEDKPYQAHFAIVASDRVVKEFDTDEAGTYRIPLPPGDYEIRQANDPAGPVSCHTNSTIVVKPHDYTWATIWCDSGIR